MTNEERRPTGLLHTADELRQLIRNNPTLPLLVFAGEEANSGDLQYRIRRQVNSCTARTIATIPLDSERASTKCVPTLI